MVPCGAGGGRGQRDRPWDMAHHLVWMMPCPTAYASSGARPISPPPRLGPRRPAEGYRGRKVKSVDCVRIVHVLRDVQYAIDAGEAVFAPALRRLLCWAVAVGRRRADLKDTTLAQYRATAERRLDRVLAMPVVTPAGAKLMRQTKR